MRLILLLIVLVPVLELAVLVAVGRAVGTWNTVLLVLLSGLLGIALAESQGLSVWRRLRASLEQGSMPGAELLDGALVLVGATLLLTPGFVTDLAGLLLLLPFVRRRIRRRLAIWLAGGKRWTFLR